MQPEWSPPSWESKPEDSIGLMGVFWGFFASTAASVCLYFAEHTRQKNLVPYAFIILMVIIVVGCLLMARRITRDAWISTLLFISYILVFGIILGLEAAPVDEAPAKTEAISPSRVSFSQVAGRYSGQLTLAGEERYVILHVDNPKQADLPTHTAFDFAIVAGTQLWVGLGEFDSAGHISFPTLAIEAQARVESGQVSVLEIIEGQKTRVLRRIGE